MFLKQIVDDLAAGELRQLYTDAQGRLTIDEEHRREIMANISVVLTDLHTRLLVKVGTLKIDILPGKRRYILLPEHAKSNSAPFEKYIDDSEVAYKGDLLKIFRILIPVEDEYVDALDNEWNNVHSFRINQFNEILVPTSYEDDHFLIEYHADFDKFSIEEAITNPETIWINLPPTLANALRLGVAARKMGTVGMTGSAVEGMNYAAKYIAEIDRIIFQNNSLNSLHMEDNSFTERGWV